MINIHSKVKHKLKEMNTRFSLRTLQARSNDFVQKKRKPSCMYIHYVSQLIKATDGSGDCYTDNYYHCSFIKQRITKKHCSHCPHYKSLIEKI